MKNKIRIGSRTSLLAIYQAKQVEKKIIEKGIKTKIIPIKSTGDLNLKQPIHKMNLLGVFTKELDNALINNYIDIAVHSLKDIPTQLPIELQLSAVLERDFFQDVLIRNPKSNKKGFENLTILTGSIRRRSFWKNYYKKVKFQSIRGNIITRLQKFQKSNADGIILSLAGIKRLNLNIKYEILDFIMPPAGQGVIGIISNKKTSDINQLLYSINHKPTMKCIKLEREFLKLFNVGCAFPIGSFAKIKNNYTYFFGKLSSLNGEKSIKIKKIIQKKSDIKNIVKNILNKGGNIILKEMKRL